MYLARFREATVLERFYKAAHVLARVLAVVFVLAPVALVVLMIWLDLTAHH